jgi:hypothetical protein
MNNSFATDELMIELDLWIVSIFANFLLSSLVFESIYSK